MGSPEPLTPEQIAAMLPDELRVYLMTLDAAMTTVQAALSEALGDELVAKRRTVTLKSELATLKHRAGIAQSALKSLKYG